MGQFTFLHLYADFHLIMIPVKAYEISFWKQNVKTMLKSDQI